MAEFISPFPNFLMASQNPIECRNGTKINPFIQQTGINFCWRLDLNNGFSLF
jgi:hypothetical protein